MLLPKSHREVSFARSGFVLMDNRESLRETDLTEFSIYGESRRE